MVHLGVVPPTLARIVSAVDQVGRSARFRVASSVPYPKRPWPGHASSLARAANCWPRRGLQTRANRPAPQTMQDEQAGRGLLIPLLRSLGNVAAGGGSAAVEQLLSPDAVPALQALVTCAQVCLPERREGF